jgi:hypothetical protein
MGGHQVLEPFQHARNGRFFKRLRQGNLVEQAPYLRVMRATSVDLRVSFSAHGVHLIPHAAQKYWFERLGGTGRSLCATANGRYQIPGGAWLRDDEYDFVRAENTPQPIER